MKKENINDWQPMYKLYGNKLMDAIINNTPTELPYKRSWFCNDNKIIHTNKKQVMTCEYCSKKYYDN